MCRPAALAVTGSGPDLPGHLARNAPPLSPWAVSKGRVFNHLVERTTQLATKTKRAVKDRRPKRKSCNFCADKALDISYRDVNRLKKYVSERGKIVPRRISGNCAKHQRLLTTAVKRARVIAFLPYVSE
jgi:small subunit ribosomal protein S18